MKAEKAEGVVFKRHDAEYEVGRPASGGPQLKFKFYATASCIVALGRTNKRSVGLQLIDGASRVSVGNVTIPPKVKMPLPEAILEIRYLYAFPGGSLYQPIYLGARHDIARAACSAHRRRRNSDRARGELRIEDQVRTLQATTEVMKKQSPARQVEGFKALNVAMAALN